MGRNQFFVGPNDCGAKLIFCGAKCVWGDSHFCGAKIVWGETHFLWGETNVGRPVGLNYCSPVQPFVNHLIFLSWFQPSEFISGSISGFNWLSA